MTILITGGTGLLGTALQNTAPPQPRITTLHHPAETAHSQSVRVESYAVDLTDHHQTARLLFKIKPTVIIHAAAQGSIDWCEENQAQAVKINAEASLNLAALSQQLRAHFVFISSNAVYSGNKSFNTESDEPNPQNFYGQTKVSVEKYLAQQNNSYTCIRPNLMFGWPPPGGRDNQVTRIISALRNKDIIKVVNDTWFSPLSAATCAQSIWQIIVNHKTGVFNVGGPTRTTLYQLSLQTAKVFNLNPSFISSISRTATPASAVRAIDTSFDITKLQQALDFSPPTVTEELRAMHTQEIMAGHLLSQPA